MRLWENSVLHNPRKKEVSHLDFIFFKYLSYEHIVVVLRCLPSEEAVGLAILKKKSEGKVGPGPMGLDGNM